MLRAKRTLKPAAFAVANSNDGAVYSVYNLLRTVPNVGVPKVV